MPEPLTLMGALKAALETLHSIWKNGALLLWACAAAALAAFFVLNFVEYYDLGRAFELKRDYAVYLFLIAAVLAVFAIFKTYAERRGRPLSLIADEQRSQWGQAKQPSGQVLTTFALRFQATNLSDGDVQLAAIRLCWPWVPARRVAQTLLFVQHPERDEYGRYPVLAHKLSPCSAHITIDRAVGRPGKRTRVIVKIQDHARRWYWLTFRHVQSMPVAS
jgi:hypothetical protein